MDVPSFDKLKIEVDEANRQKWMAYRNWQVWDKEYKRLHKVLIKSCEHVWVRDLGNSSPGRSHHVCRKCDDFH